MQRLLICFVVGLGLLFGAFAAAPASATITTTTVTVTIIITTIVIAGGIIIIATVVGGIETIGSRELSEGRSTLRPSPFPTSLSRETRFLDVAEL